MSDQNTLEETWMEINRKLEQQEKATRKIV